MPLADLDIQFLIHRTRRIGIFLMNFNTSPVLIMRFNCSKVLMKENRKIIRLPYERKEF